MHFLNKGKIELLQTLKLFFFRKRNSVQDIFSIFLSSTKDLSLCQVELDERQIILCSIAQDSFLRLIILIASSIQFIGNAVQNLKLNSLQIQNKQSSRTKRCCATSQEKSMLQQNVTRWVRLSWKYTEHSLSTVSYAKKLSPYFKFSFGEDLLLSKYFVESRVLQPKPTLTTNVLLETISNYVSV